MAIEFITKMVDLIKEIILLASAVLILIKSTKKGD